MDKVHFTTAAYDDTWLRDSGPITLRRTYGGFQLLDFRFTGWGGKFDATLDDQLVGVLDQAGVFNDAPVRSIPFALEGGGIETDGEGTLLTTWKCLHERHPDRDRASLSADLADWLQQDRVLWLDHGYLEGDDTDAHIDTLARFASSDSIVYQACDDESDSHYAELQAMGNELAALRTKDGQPYRLFPLPWAQPVIDEGRRLAASYANYLIVNGAVLMPAYGDPADDLARDVLALYAHVTEKAPDALACDTLLLRIVAAAHSPYAPQASSRAIPAAIRHARALIDDDPAAALSLADLAAVSGLSRYQVCNAACCSHAG
ncbi:hypothetical protein G6F68_011314 [Rhizopus microsporus]|nr:hypothetical protein G6F68_011314 [Rhizopus microsporus]